MTCTGLLILSVHYTNSWPTCRRRARSARTGTFAGLRKINSAMKRENRAKKRKGGGKKRGNGRVTIKYQGGTKERIEALAGWMV